MYIELSRREQLGRWKSCSTCIELMVLVNYGFGAVQGTVPGVTVISIEALEAQ